MQQQDLVIIGGGTSGFIVAAAALKHGLKVTLIEKNKSLGGSALHFGCIPSKALLHVAHLVHTIENATQYGLESYVAPADLSKLNARVQDMIKNLEAKDAQEAQHMFDQLGGQIIYGSPKFIDAKTIGVEDVFFQAKKFVIATGSKAEFPAIKGLAESGYITSDMVCLQQVLPQNLVVLGDRSDSIEFAQAFARLGAKVSVIVSGDSILANEDPELINKLRESLINEGINFYLNTQVLSVYVQKQIKNLECMHDSGEKFVIRGDEILVALGRKPNVEGIGLENAGVKYSTAGIVVNQKLQTTQKHIYALGDVICSPYKLTHMAEYQASIVLSNAIFKYPNTVKYQGFPYVIFTSPEYAQVGLSEQQAKEQKYKNIEVLRFDFKDLDSAVLQHAATGLIKVVASNGKVIGAAILGPQASNLISEWGLAINLGAKVADVAATIHAYPTLAQVNRRVANKHATKRRLSDLARHLVARLQFT